MITKLAVLLFALLPIQIGELRKADPMTADEMQELQRARDEVDAAQRKADAIANKIMLAHGCRSESWMEWSSVCSIEGNFVTRRYTNYMSNPAGGQR